MPIWSLRPSLPSTLTGVATIREMTASVWRLLAGTPTARCEWTKVTGSKMTQSAALVELAEWKAAEAERADLSRQLAADLDRRLTV